MPESFNPHIADSPYIDRTDPDWGEFVDSDRARWAEECKEKDRRLEIEAIRNKLDAEWAVEAGWVSPTTFEDWSTQSFDAAEVAAASEQVRRAANTMGSAVVSADVNVDLNLR